MNSWKSDLGLLVTPLSDLHNCLVECVEGYDVFGQMAETWRSLAALARRRNPRQVRGKPDRLDTATRMAMDADFSDRGQPSAPAREPFREADQSRS